MKAKFLFLSLASASILLIASCNKMEAPTPVADEPLAEESVTVPEAVDILTKSITKEDLQDLSLFLKEGEAERSLYLKIEKGGTTLLSGEIGLVEGEHYKVLNLDLKAVSYITITGTVDLLKLATGLAGARLSIGNELWLQESLAFANSAVDVKVTDGSYLEFRPYVDDETGKTTIEAYLVSFEDPDDATLVSALIELLSSF